MYILRPNRGTSCENVYLKMYIFLKFEFTLPKKNIPVNNECKCKILSLIYTYTPPAPKLMPTASVAQSVERWSRDSGSLVHYSQPEALELHFSQLIPVGC